jgi:hypothetical protein
VKVSSLRREMALRQKFSISLKLDMMVGCRCWCTHKMLVVLGYV